MTEPILNTELHKQLIEQRLVKPSTYASAMEALEKARNKLRNEQEIQHEDNCRNPRR